MFFFVILKTQFFGLRGRLVDRVGTVFYNIKFVFHVFKILNTTHDVCVYGTRAILRCDALAEENIEKCSRNTRPVFDEICSLRPPHDSSVM